MRRGINNKGYKDDRNSAIANGNRRKKKKVKIIDLNKIKKQTLIPLSMMLKNL